MRRVRIFVVLAALSLCSGTSVASAAERPFAYASQEVSGMARILAQVKDLLTAIWENEAGCIDPWGRCSPGGTAPPQEDTGTPSTDGAGYIDPLGGC